MPALDIALALVARINAHDVGGICELMTEELFGAASGSFVNAPRESWRVTAAWKAKIAGELVAEWSVCCDTA